MDRAVFMHDSKAILRVLGPHGLNLTADQRSGTGAEATQRFARRRPWLSLVRRFVEPLLKIINNSVACHGGAPTLVAVTFIYGTAEYAY